MADPNIFGNMFSATTGMGNPLTEMQKPVNPYDPRKENEFLPWMVTDLKNERAIENDPTRIREQVQVYKELRAEEAANAARIQADREKRQFQYQLAASIPNTINQIGQNIAQATLNPLRLQILADTPGKITQAYGALPRINIPDFR
jgi:hypothetical protein